MRLSTKSCIVVLFVFSNFILSAQNEPTIKRGAKVIQLLKHDVSLKLRDIPPVPIPAGPKRVIPIHPLPKPQPDPRKPVTGGIDPGLQTVSGPPLIPSPNRNFDGAGDGFTGPQGTYNVNVAPPDTNGDIGPTHYVQTVNLVLSIFNKSGTVIYGPVNINTLWSGFGGQCQTSNSGDPVVIYDQFNDRWIISQFAVASQPYLQCIAVSTTGDPTGSYNRFSYSYANGFNDYPKLGVWNGDYFITYNMFLNGQSFSGGKVCAFQGSKLRAGQANTMQCFDEPNGGLLAADIDGSSTPPAGAPEYVMSFGSNVLNIWKLKIDWTTPANSTFTGPITVAVNAFNEACGGGTCITQPATTQLLDSLGDRLMNRLAYRNRSGVESFLANHSISAAGGVSGVRWYELRTLNSSTTTPTLFQQGTFSPDTNHRWMGSIAMDQAGNVATGYSVSSSANNVKPSIRYTGRLASDPAGQLPQGESILFTGTGVQNGGLNRWGDYSAINVDPTDDCTFWITSEYLAADGSFNWHTRIGSFKFNNCGSGSGDLTPPTTSITSPTNGNSVSGTIAVNANAADNIGVSSVEFFADDLSIGTDTTNPYSINWNTTAVSNGGHALTSRAYDAAGNVGVSLPVNVTVNNPGVASYDSILKAPRCSTVSPFCDSGPLLIGRNNVGPEVNQPNTINNSCADGASGSFHFDESNDKLRVSTTDNSNLAPGKNVTVQATVWVYSTFSSDALDLYYAADATNPSWILIGTILPTAAGQQTLSASYTLPSGNLQAVRANFRFQGATSSCSSGAYDDHDDLIFATGSGCTLPPAPSVVSPANGSTGVSITPLLDWSDVTGATSYDVQVCTDAACNSVVRSQNVAASTWTVSPALNNNTAYFWRIRTNNSCGPGAFSTSASFTTVAGATCTLTSQLLKNPGFESGNVNWSSSNTGVIGSTSAIYPSRTGTKRALLNANNEFTKQTITIPANACSATFSFYYRVKTTETATTGVDKLRLQIFQGATLLASPGLGITNLSKKTTYTLKSGINLISYKGKTITLKLSSLENNTTKISNFLIDDTAVNVTQ